jgi:hypothetical protein
MIEAWSAEPPAPKPPVHEYWVALDLGCYGDFSALCALELETPHRPGESTYTVRWLQR